MLAVALGASAGGCAVSYKLDSFFGKKKDEAETTGSVPVAASDAKTAIAATALPPDADLAYARAAAARMLQTGGKDASLPWENPASGARGTVTAIAAAYTRDGFTCRDFLASYVRGANESWLQGGACRVHHGTWTVRSLRPLKRS